MDARVLRRAQLHRGSRTRPARAPEKEQGSIALRSRKQCFPFFSPIGDSDEHEDRGDGTFPLIFGSSLLCGSRIEMRLILADDIRNSHDADLVLIKGGRRRAILARAAEGPLQALHRTVFG